MMLRSPPRLRDIVVRENGTGNNSTSPPVVTANSLGTFDDWQPGVEIKGRIRVADRWLVYAEFMWLRRFEGTANLHNGVQNAVGASFALPFTRDISTHFDFATSVDVRLTSRILGTGIGAKFLLNEWLSLYGGLRYIQLREELDILAIDSTSPGSGAYNLTATNNLFGGIFGASVSLKVLPRLTVNLSAGAGPFLNGTRVEHFVLDTQNPSATRNEVNRESRFSVVTEARLNATYEIMPGIGAFVGYQMMFISNLALSQRELNFDTTTAGTIAQGVGVRGNGTVIYHGGVAGVKLTF